MEKIIIIDGQELPLKSNGALPLKYKFQFHRDSFQDMVKLRNVADEKGNLLDIEQLDLEIFYNFVWILAKTANPEIPPLMEWMETFDSFPIMDVVPEIMDMIISNMQTSKKKSKITGHQVKK